MKQPWVYMCSPSRSPLPPPSPPLISLSNSSYLETLQKSLSSSSVLLVSLGTSLYSIMSSANKNSFTSSFPIWVPFIYFLIAIVRKFKWSGERTFLFLFLILEKIFSFFQHYDICCRLVTNDLYFVKVCSLYTHFVESFCHEWVWSCVSIEVNTEFLFINLLIWCITLINL